MTNEEMQKLIDIMRQVARTECKKILKENNIETIMYGKVIASTTKGYTVQIAGGDKPYTGLKNKSNSSISIGDSVIIKAINGNAGNGYIAVKMG